ncbi:hypothetical protein [Gorillibacterium sp. sgz500922]|uniref:hypothetical protein n=1 Tax=Gorillibacterium sp. sgz500922 TaxID=3446694 RepID=UPI003F679857
MKKWIISVACILILYGCLDAALFFLHYPTMYSKINRIIHGAPVVQLRGWPYIYSGKVQVHDGPYVPYKTSDTGIRLYKAPYFPPEQIPPSVYVKKDESTYYQYIASFHETDPFAFLGN